MKQTEQIYADVVYQKFTPHVQRTINRDGYWMLQDDNGEWLPSIDGKLYTYESLDDVMDAAMEVGYLPMCDNPAHYCPICQYMLPKFALPDDRACRCATALAVIR